jgi:SNF2 family DNA or RNA helicase
VEPAWTPADNAQAIKRVHRIGTTTSVRARIFAVVGTLDEAIIGSVVRKTLMQLEVGL